LREIVKIELTISLVALSVSGISLYLSTPRAAVDRKLQWEQLRGNVLAKLTARGLELITLIQELMSSPSEEIVNLIHKLIQISKGIVSMREGVTRMEIPPSFRTSALLTRYAPIKTQLDNADLIFDKLKIAVRKKNMTEASELADGLYKRFYGSGDVTIPEAPSPSTIAKQD
jgi:hypothetical protein